jgi:hypothetical protein
MISSAGSHYLLASWWHVWGITGAKAYFKIGNIIQSNSLPDFNLIYELSWI